MLRLLIGTGVLLMAVGFGAAGWQYWQSLPKVAAVEVEAATPQVAAVVRQSWLISPSGGLIPQDEVRAYLAQERFIQGRTVRVQRQASLNALLAEGEKLVTTRAGQARGDPQGPTPPVCAVAVFPEQRQLGQSIDAADSVVRTPDNGIVFAGEGRSVTLFSQ